MELSFLERQKRIYHRLLKMHLDSGLDHLGSAQSCFEIMSLLFLELMNHEEDQFILSKGHAISLLYACLAEVGQISEDQCAMALQPKGLPAHAPSRKLCPPLHFGSGSLGHGLPVAVGMALAKKKLQEKGKIYVLLSDGECNEGSIWEAALFSAHHQLDNLRVIIDRNRWQCLGATEEVLRLDPLGAKWKSFGFEVVDVANGHDLVQLKNAFLNSPDADDFSRPRVLIAETIKAHGLPQFYETVDSHYFKLNSKDYEFLMRSESSQTRDTSQ